MTTRATLKTRLKRMLHDDAGQVFSDAQLNQWIDEATEDYSRYFPRETTATLSCTTGTHAYALTTLTGIQSVTLVEYPSGQDPPQYLQRRSVDDLRDSGFWGEEFYDLYGDPPHTIVIAQDATTGQSIIVRYLADHTNPSADNSTLTVPDRDLIILEMFVRWRALVALESGEAAAPTPAERGAIPILSLLGTNSRGARREYDKAISDRSRAQSKIVRWGSQDDWRV